MPDFKDLTPEGQITVLRRRIGSFHKALNTKLKSGHSLSKQAIGPLILYSLPIAKQVQQLLDELNESYDNLKTTLVAIINRVEADNDNTNYDYYTEYLNTINTEFDECRLYITIALGTVSATPSASIAADDKELDSAGGADGSAAAAKVCKVRPKAVRDLQPEKLTKETKPAQFQIWTRSLRAYWLASQFPLCVPETQHEYLRKVVDSKLMLLIENSIKPDMPVLPIDDKPQLGSVLDLLSAECLARHPMVSRRYELFRMEQAAGSTLTEYINRLRDPATNAELVAIEPSDFICFYALATCKDTFHSVKEDALKVPPEELNLEKLMTLARKFENVEFALNNMRFIGSPGRCVCKESKWHQAFRGT